MVLKKRYRRDIRHNLSLYVSATILTVLALMLFYLYDISGTGIKSYAEQVFADQKIEDANFSTYQEIPDEKIREYEQKYDLELEKQRYLNLENGGITARVFSRTSKIDIHYVTAGRDAAAEDEVVISEGFAQNMGIVIGDSLEIGDKTYTVTGFAERPDYLFMLQNLGDADKNIATFYICYMTDRAFDDLGETNCQYLVRYHQDNHREFRKDVHDNYMMRTYTGAKDNLRINMVIDQPELFISMGYISLFILPLMAVVLISTILSRKIRNEQKMIGTLASYGYTNRQIITHYALFAAIPGILGGVLTTVVVAILAQPYGNMGLMDYEPLKVDFKLHIPQMILGIVIPTLLYMIATIFTVNRLLRNDITTLLRGAVKGKSRYRKYLVGKRVPLRRKFSVRSLLGNPGRTCVLFFGVFLGSFVVLWALGCLDTAHNIGTVTADNMGNYNYQYVLNSLETENPYGGETILSASAEDRDATVLSVFGADGNSLLGLRDEAGNALTVDDGYIITSLYATLHDVAVGDRMTIINPLTLESYELEIAAIAENNYASAIYTSRKNVSRMCGVDESVYNTILSKEPLDIPQKNVAASVSRDTIDQQYEAAIEQINTIIYLFVGVGILLCVISVYIAVNMTVTENRRNISMLGVLGYNRANIYRLLLRDNIWVVIPAIICSIPCVIAASTAVFRSFAEILGYLMDVYIKPSTYLWSILLTLAGYYVSVLLVSRKIGKIDMVESLKENRE